MLKKPTEKAMFGTVLGTDLAYRRLFLELNPRNKPGITVQYTY